MAKRVKKTIITGVSKDAAEEAFAVYAKADAAVSYTHLTLPTTERV